MSFCESLNRIRLFLAETWFNDFRWPVLFAGWVLTWGNVYMMEYTDILPGLGSPGGYS